MKYWLVGTSCRAKPEQNQSKTSKAAGGGTSIESEKYIGADWRITNQEKGD